MIQSYTYQVHSRSWTCSCFSTCINIKDINVQILCYSCPQRSVFLNFGWSISCAFIVKVLHEPDSVQLLVFVWIKHAYFLFLQGKGVEAGPDQVVWRLTCCMGLHRMLPVFTRLKPTQMSNDNPACIEANLLYCHPRQTIRVPESKPPVPPFGAHLNKPTHYYPPVI